MGIIEIILISLGLAMDAFAVSICKGLSMKKMNWKKALIIGAYFGFFQMMMPVIGYMLGIGFNEWLESIDHWIAFILLGFIGLKMIKESLNYKYRCTCSRDYLCIFRYYKLYRSIFNYRNNNIFTFSNRSKIGE